jgi:hypothetical protein
MEKKQKKYIYINLKYVYFTIAEILVSSKLDHLKFNIVYYIPIVICTQTFTLFDLCMT